MKNLFNGLGRMMLIVCLIALVFSGCAKTGTFGGGDGKVTISIGNYPSDAQPKLREQMDKLYNEFIAKNPDINVEKDTWYFDLRTYLTKAASGQLPTLYTIYPTELKNIINLGYAYDLSETLDKNGWADMLNKNYEKLYKYDNKIYGIPKRGSLYEMGILCNIDMFKEAGLVDSNGMPIYPSTWDELANTAQKIKEKTGKAGLGMATMNNHGGWHFMSLAWAYGTEFMVKENDTYKAIFASPEGISAMQYIKDLKWKYDVVQSEILANVADCGRMFAVGDVGMVITQPSMIDQFVQKFDLDVSKCAMFRMPAGPKGRYSLTSAEIYIIREDATEQQVDAALKWIEHIGDGPSLTDEVKNALEESYKLKNSENKLVGVRYSPVWNSPEMLEFEREVSQKYATVDVKYFEDYLSGKDVTYSFEPERSVQQLYAVLDSVIQEVLTNKDADVESLMKKAQNDLQLNYLDKEQ